jgi:hypothetical protein
MEKKTYRIVTPDGRQLKVKCFWVEEGQEGQTNFLDEDKLLLAIAPAQSLIFIITGDYITWEK